MENFQLNNKIAFFICLSEDLHSKKEKTAQIRKCRNYAKRKGYTMEKVFFEALPEKKEDQFFEIWADIESGLFTRVIVQGVNKNGRSSFYDMSFHQLPKERIGFRPLDEEDLTLEQMAALQ